MGKLIAEEQCWRCLEILVLADSALLQIAPQPLAAVRLLGDLLSSRWNGQKQVQSPRPPDQYVYHRLHPLHVHRVRFCPRAKQPVRGQVANVQVKADNY